LMCQAFSGQEHRSGRLHPWRPKNFAMMYRKTYKVDITDREFTDKVVRLLIDQNGDNIIEEMDISFADEVMTQIMGESTRKVLQL
jgi:hypothetical protein